MKSNQSVLQIKPLFIKFILLFLMCFFTACATGVSHVKLYDPLTYKSEKEKGVGSVYASIHQQLSSKNIKLAMNKVKDNRPDITCIGVKKNTYGMKMGKVDVEEGVVFIDLFKKNLINVFELAGYEIIPFGGSYF
ncbi:MAG: hypothetical protein QXD02_04490 [Candidatus Parvarchaeum sp.]|nr:hypothetical protein [Candidatus Parvarchaeum tengchongense]